MSATKKTPQVLIVDDELSMREFLSILLEKEGYQTRIAATADQALKLLADHAIDLLITDIRMPDMNGLELLAEAKKSRADLPCIMITAYASPDDAVLAMRHGAYDYITKPFKVEAIKNIVAAALHVQAQSHPARSQTDSFCGIIGQSAEMQTIFEIIQRIAPTQANVLIYGESGTGKELVARAIHANSKVADRQLVPIICSAIPESLFESELFGHVKGSFTGATDNKTGLFAQANGGSVFLDEIGELSPLLQTKLLRVIQERECKPVGGTTTIKVDARLISATNKDLEQAVMDGSFREDLFFRLAVVPIRVPPLRERKEDIPLLVNHFLEKYSRLFGKNIQALSSYAMEVLLEYDFPGNVRELENIIERGVAMEHSNIILPESLVLAAHRRNQALANQQGGGRNSAYSQARKMGLESYLAQVEKEIISEALRATGNSKMQAAKLLQISFRSLRYKVQKYDIGSPADAADNSS